MEYPKVYRSLAALIANFSYFCTPHHTIFIRLIKFSTICVITVIFDLSVHLLLLGFSDLENFLVITNLGNVHSRFASIFHWKNNQLCELCMYTQFRKVSIDIHFVIISFHEMCKVFSQPCGMYVTKIIFLSIYTLQDVHRYFLMK